MMIIQFTGLSGSGKSTLAILVKEELSLKGISVEIIDGDEYRKTICKGLGFSYEDRVENLDRLAFIAKLLYKHNIVTIISAINPFENKRIELKNSKELVKTIWINCDLSTLINRDPKGYYQKALLPNEHPDKIRNFTGITDIFETPENPDLIVNTHIEDILTSKNKIVQFILKELNKDS